MRAVFQQLLALAAALAVFPTPAAACQICVPVPKKSAADHLLAARTVVLAREASFAYQPVEILKGERPGAAIDLLVDSKTRRMLAARPELSILLAETPEGTWRRLGVAEAEFTALARHVLESTKGWKAKPQERVEFFAGKLDHASAQIRNLAALEVGRAPYADIRKLASNVPREKVRAFLADLRYVEWHPLYILLLAQSQEARDHQRITDAFRAAARFGTTTRLAAWTTAYIEIGGEQAIAEVERQFFGDTGREEKELQEVVRALSVHGNTGAGSLRDRVVRAYGVLVANHPSLTPQVAKDLISWKRTELAAEVARYTASKPREIDFQTFLKLRAYAQQSTN